MREPEVRATNLRFVGRTSSFSGKNLECAWIGEPSRRAIVMLHEGLGCVAAWRDLPARVAARSGESVFLYSRFGYGRSDPVPLPRPLTYMHDEAAMLPEICALAGIHEPLLLGHSDGASIAIVAAGSGFRTRALLLLAPHVFCEDCSVAAIEKAKDAYEHGDLRARLAKYHANVDVAFWGWNRAWLDPAFRAWNLEGFLPNIEVPVTVVQGEADPYGTLAQVDAIERGVRGSFERVIIPGVGHALQREGVDSTLEALAALAARAR